MFGDIWRIRETSILPSSSIDDTNADWRTHGATTVLTPDELQRFHAGEPAIFRQLHQQYTTELIDSIRSLTETPEDAQDVAQEAWLRVFKQRQRFTGAGSLRGWIHTIARSAAIDYYRSSKRRQRRLTLFEVMQAAEPMEDQLHTPSGDEFSLPDELVRHKWRTRGELIDAIVQLTPRQRDVIVLRFLAGRSTRDVAKAMEITQPTVRSLVYQAVRALQRRIWRSDEGELWDDAEE